MSKNLTVIELAFLAGYLQAKGRPTFKSAITNQTGRKYLRILLRSTPQMSKLLVKAFGGRITGDDDGWWTINGKAAHQMFDTLMEYFTPARQKGIQQVFDQLTHHNSQYPSKQRGRPRHRIVR